MNNGHFNNGGMYNNYNQSQPHMHQRQPMYGYNQQPQQQRQSAPINFSMHSSHLHQQQSQMQQQPRRHSMPAPNQYQINNNIQHTQQQPSPSPNIVNVNNTSFNINNSIEHQQCIQFLQSRNFSHDATPQQRQEILTKIGNALSNKYTHNELQRRSLILRQSASHILSTTKPKPAPIQNNLMDDIISSPIRTNNTTSTHTSTNGDVAIGSADFSDFNDPFDANQDDNNNNADDDDEWGDFGDANPSKPAVIDLLGPLDTDKNKISQNENSDPLDLINTNDQNNEDDFAKFVGEIKAKPSIEAYMMAAFAGNKLDSVGKSKKKMSEIAPQTESNKSFETDTCIFDEVKEVPKAPPKAKALPDIFNQIIEEKLNADDFGDGFDDFTGAENEINEEVEEKEENVENEVEAVLDLPMDVFLSEAGSANKEYDKKMAERLKEREESEAERQKREQLEIMEKLKNKPPDPFLNLFGPQIVKKEKKKEEVVVEDDEWGDFDNDDNVQNAEDDFFNAPFDDINDDKVKIDDGDKEDEIDWNEFGTTDDVPSKIEKEIVKDEESFDVDFGSFDDDKMEKKENKKKSKEQRKKERKERKRQKKEKEKKEKKVKKKEIIEAGDDSFDIDFGEFEQDSKPSKKENKTGKNEKKKEAPLDLYGGSLQNRVQTKNETNTLDANVEVESFDIDFDEFEDANTPKNKNKKKSKEKKEKKSKKNKKKKEKKSEDLDLSFNGFDDSITKSAETNNVFDEIKPQKTPTPISVENNSKVEVEENEIDFDGFAEWSQSEKEEKEIKKPKSINLKVEDEDDWDLRYEQQQTQKQKESVKKEAPQDLYGGSLQNRIQTKNETDTLDANDDDDDDWGDFDAPLPENETEQNIKSVDNDDDDWGDFGDDNTENQKNEPSVTMSMSKDILPSFPLDDDAEEQSNDNLSIPTEKDWKRSKSLQSIQNEESLSDFKNFGPEISANNHESLDLDFEDEEVENELSEIEETNEISQNDDEVELNPFENPFAAIINDADEENNTNEDNPFDDTQEEEEEEDIDEDPFGDMDEDDVDNKEAVVTLKAAINPFETQLDETQIIEAIDAEQYEKALLLFELQQKHSNLEKNRYQSQVLEAEIAKNKQLDDDDDDERQLEKQQNLQKLMDLEKDKMRIRAEIKCIDRSIDQFNLSSMDILPYCELLQISKKNDKLPQFSEFFGKRFDEYLPSTKPYKINEELCNNLKIVIVEQKKAHFFVNAVSNKQSVKNDIKLYEQFLCLSQTTFEDANERLIKLKKNLEMCKEEYLSTESHKKLFDSFLLHFDHLLILYKMCKSVGNGLHLINKVFEDEDIIKTWRIIDDIFNDSIVCLRNEIIKTFMNEETEDKIWNLTQFDQNNELLPNKEQLSQIVMHLNGI